MHIASFRIENYKSFRATDEVPLSPGFNVIVGQNNVGKTALVEALSLRFAGHPHRSLKTAPTRLTPVPSGSSVAVQLDLSRDELFQLLRRLGNFYAPTMQPNGQSAAAELTQAVASPTSTLVTSWQNSQVASARLASMPAGLSETRCAVLRISASDAVELAQDGLVGVSANSRFEWQVAQLARDERVYAFNAERLRVGIAPLGTSTALRSDATNLPEVLASLKGRNPHRYERLVDHIRTVFPSVRDIGFRPREGNAVEILVWTVEPQTEREDLAVSLAESGTGIGQVLAMLYVVLTADFPQVILIDEPQSFLHPGAVRKLIEILRGHPQHQFIITTHSPTALTTADPETLLRLRIEEGETIIDRVDVREARDLRLVLADIGARLSDVFGADAILWVEGPTEEHCFPKILQRLTTQPLLGTAIVGVMHTADFDARRSEATVQLYHRLSAGRGLVPPAVGFIFDREGRSDGEREDLERYGNVFFLPRRMYENYLLNPTGVAAVASNITGFRDPSLTEAEVRAWLDQNRWNARYFDPLPEERTDIVWLREVRGGRLLADLFSQLSEQRVQYDKVRHGAGLTDWLLEHAPDDLREVAQLITRALPPPAA
jgi:hypothetical protein